MAQELWARAKNVEVWFLNHKKPKRQSSIPFKLHRQFAHYAQMETKCIEVDGYCYDSKLGIYVKPEQLSQSTMMMHEKKDIAEAPEAASFDGPIATTKAELLQNADLVKCDKDQFFDLFCGQSKKVEALTSGGIEVYIDTSSSLYAIDPEDESQSCARKKFAESIQSACADVQFFAFDTNKKSVTNLQDLCLNVGLNDTKKIIEWVEESTAQHMIILTDIGEYTTELSDYLTKIGGQIKGAEVEEPFTPLELVAHASLVAKHCTK